MEGLTHYMWRIEQLMRSTGVQGASSLPCFTQHGGDQWTDASYSPPVSVQTLNIERCWKHGWRSEMNIDLRDLRVVCVCVHAFFFIPHFSKENTAVVAVMNIELAASTEVSWLQWRCFFYSANDSDCCHGCAGLNDIQYSPWNVAYARTESSDKIRALTLMEVKQCAEKTYLYFYILTRQKSHLKPSLLKLFVLTVFTDSIQFNSSYHICLHYAFPFWPYLQRFTNRFGH